MPYQVKLQLDVSGAQLTLRYDEISKSYTFVGMTSLTFIENFHSAVIKNGHLIKSEDRPQAIDWYILESTHRHDSVPAQEAFNHIFSMIEMEPGYSLELKKGDLVQFSFGKGWNSLFWLDSLKENPTPLVA